MFTKTKITLPRQVLGDVLNVPTARSIVVAHDDDMPIWSTRSPQQKPCRGSTTKPLCSRDWISRMTPYDLRRPFAAHDQSSDAGTPPRRPPGRVDVDEHVAATGARRPWPAADRETP
jgi:hypothetical protein